jgi:hypothetical protein
VGNPHLAKLFARIDSVPLRSFVTPCINGTVYRAGVDVAGLRRFLRALGCAGGIPNVQVTRSPPMARLAGGTSSDADGALAMAKAHLSIAEERLRALTTGAKSQEIAAQEALIKRRCHCSKVVQQMRSCSARPKGCAGRWPKNNGPMESS